MYVPERSLHPQAPKGPWEQVGEMHPEEGKLKPEVDAEAGGEWSSE